MLTDPATAASMSARSLDIVGEHSLDATLDAFESTYRCLLPGPTGASRPTGRRPHSLGARW